MKIIDLLNKIANGEEVPKKIKYDTKEMKYDYNKQDYLGYYSNGNGEWLFQYLFDKCRNTEHFINDEVEILEEEKKIPEKLETYKENNEIFLENFCYKYMPIHKDSLSFNEQVIVDKLNEVLDYLKSKGKQI